MRANKRNKTEQQASENQQEDQDPSDQEQTKQQNRDNNPQNDCDNSPKIIPIAKMPDKLKNKKIVINISDTQYPIIEEVAEDMGWQIQQNQGIGDWDVWWTDRQINPDVLYRMNLHQKINHFPGISQLARKNLLALNLSSMQQKFPNDYNFFPKTWSIPIQFPQFRKHFAQKQKTSANQTYIVKPQALSQGRGIFLTRNINDILNGQKYVIQKYVDNPMLIDGLKFDLRLYVLLKSVDPLKIYIYKEGLVRLATQKYQKVNENNLKKIFMHLTNYSLNKRNPLYQKNQVVKQAKNKQKNQNENIDSVENSCENKVQEKVEQKQSDSEQSLPSLDTQELEQIQIGHKRSLSSFWEHLARQGYTDSAVEKLQQQINDLIVKTIISGSPALLHQYKYCQPESPQETNMCFHILGFDVMITDELIPMIIQINHTPSFETNSQLDYTIKKGLISDTLKLMEITEKRKRKLFKKGKQINKRRLQTGRREVVANKNSINNTQIFQDQIIGGFTRLHPILVDQSSKNYKSQKQKSDRYQILMKHAQIVHRQTAQTRKKMLKQDKDCQKNKQPHKNKDRNGDLSCPIQNKTSFSNLHKNIENSQRIVTSSNNRQNSFRTKTTIKKNLCNKQSIPCNEQQLTEQEAVSSEYHTNTENKKIKKQQQKIIKKTKIQFNCNTQSWKQRQKKTQLLKFSEIMMKLVVTRDQSNFKTANLGNNFKIDTHQFHNKHNKLIISHKQAHNFQQQTCLNTNRQSKTSQKKFPGNFIAPKTYQIVDSHHSRKQLDHKSNAKFNEMLSSIEHKPKKQIIDPQIINPTSYKVNNKMPYKKKKRYSVL